MEVYLISSKFARIKLPPKVTRLVFGAQMNGKRSKHRLICYLLTA